MILTAPCGNKVYKPHACCIQLYVRFSISTCVFTQIKEKVQQKQHISIQSVYCKHDARRGCERDLLERRGN